MLDALADSTDECFTVRVLLMKRCETPRRNANYSPKHLRKGTRAGVADFRRDLDQAAFGLKAWPLLRSLYGADELSGAGDALVRDELQRSHAGRLFEDARKMEGT